MCLLLHDERRSIKISYFICCLASSDTFRDKLKCKCWRLGFFIVNVILPNIYKFTIYSLVVGVVGQSTKTKLNEVYFPTSQQYGQLSLITRSTQCPTPRTIKKSIFHLIKEALFRSPPSAITTTDDGKVSVVLLVRLFLDTSSLLVPLIVVTAVISIRDVD